MLGPFRLGEGPPPRPPCLSDSGGAPCWPSALRRPASGLPDPALGARLLRPRSRACRAAWATVLGSPGCASPSAVSGQISDLHRLRLCL